MIKKIIFIVVLFLGFNSFGQDIVELRKKANTTSDKELLVFVKKAKDQGLSLAEAEKQFSLLGAKPKEIKRLRDLWDEETPEDEPNLFEDSDNENQSKFGNTIPFEEEENNEIDSEELLNEDEFTIDDEVEELKRFGSDFFNNENIVETPQLFVSTPADYRLGPGDELIINLFGASENTYSVQISRNGNVKFDKLAPVFLSGLSVGSASRRLKSRLSKIYTGLEF